MQNRPSRSFNSISSIMIIIFTHIKFSRISSPARNARKYVLCENFYVYSSTCRGCGVPTVPECSEIQVKFKIPTVMPPLTRSRGEYLRVVGIHSDG